MRSLAHFSEAAPTTQSAETTQGERAVSGTAGATISAVKAGTVVFAAFSAICLTVSITEGVVPILLIESAGWAGLAWFWQSRKAYGELAKGIVTTLAIVVAVGEVIYTAMQASPSSRHGSPTSHAPVYPSASTETNLNGDFANPPTRSTVADVKPSTKPKHGESSKISTPKLSADATRRQALNLYTDGKYLEAAPLLDRSCKNGYGYTCEVLGFMYDIALGVPGDSSRAKALYQRTVNLYSDSCDSGSADGCSHLEDLYDGQEQIGSPHIDEKYLPRKITLFTNACDARSAEGCRYLGDLYWKGEGTVQDHAKAAGFYARSCDANNGDGCTELANSYKLGLGVEKNAAQARELFVKGCNLGTQWACDEVKETQ